MTKRKTNAPRTWDDIVRDRLHQWFVLSGFTQQQVGDAIGYSQTAVSAYFLGRAHKLSLERAAKMAHLFQRDVRLLIVTDEVFAADLARPLNEEELLLQNFRRMPAASQETFLKLVKLLNYLSRKHEETYV